MTDKVIQFFYWDFLNFGTFDFINGLYTSIENSDLYIVDKNKKIDAYYKDNKKFNILFNDNIIRDNVLIIIGTD